MSTSNHVADQLQEVQNTVNTAAEKSPFQQKVQLLAVSKTWPCEHIQPAIDAGHLHFAENKLQEGQEKIPQLSESLHWHYIGRLQKNKIRKIIKLFHVIHSFDSLKLLQYADRIAGEEAKTPQVLLQINLAEEEQKGGFTKDALLQALPEIQALQHLKVVGLMIIPPAVKEAEKSRPWFSKLRELQGELNQGHSLNWQELSMGMSNDYAIAIEEGATMVRVGSAIFGQRH